MQNSNETVAEIRGDVNEYLTSIGPSEYPDETQFEEFADRFVAAHRHEVAELRECLKEACRYRCGKCNVGNLETESHFCGNYCDTIKRWRKALEGGQR